MWQQSVVGVAPAAIELQSPEDERGSRGRIWAYMTSI